MTAPLLELSQASKRFAVRADLAETMGRWFGAAGAGRAVHAVDRVDLTVRRGEVVALVGESGSGKSTLGRLAAGLLPLSSGTRRWSGRGSETPSGDLGTAQRLAVQMIFQDANAALNPRMRVTDLVGEAPLAHGLIRRAERDTRVAEILEKVGLDGALQRGFAHQFSGGQRARIGIARALAVDPEFLVCDEALAALDVSIQAQILNLFIRLRQELGLTYLFISHDLAVVRHIAERVYIMYLGKIVESAPAKPLFSGPNHPYTQALLAEAPTLEVQKRRFIAIKGEIPSPLSPPPGCHFHPRCPHVMPRCRREEPLLRDIAPERFSACHLNESS